MAKLAMIDRNKPLSFEASTLTVLADPDLRQQALALSLPQLLNIDVPTPSAQPLLIAETGDLIDWLLATPWGTTLAVNLQGMAEDGDGRPLLTTWLSAAAFGQLAADADGQPFGPRLLAAYVAWKELGTTTVYVHGYEVSHAGGDPGHSDDVADAGRACFRAKVFG